MQRCSEHEGLQDLLREMHGDIKSLMAEFKAMNGSLKETKVRFDKHEDSSDTFRHRITIVWTIIHTLKYLIMLLLGSGLLWKAAQQIL